MANDLRQQVIATQRKVHDLMDKPTNAAARTLTREIQALEDELQVHKNWRSVEDRVKRIIHILEGEAKTNRIMNYEHLEMFRHWFEHLREQIRKLT